MQASGPPRGESKGESRGVADDRLLCLVRLNSTFVRLASDISQRQMAFVAATGTLLVRSMG